MNKKYTLGLVVFFIASFVLLVSFMHSGGVAVLDPKGLIALQERNLIVIAVLLMLIVVVPVYVLTFLIAWKYRASNTAAIYTPDHDHDLRAELVWWAIPCAIILVLALITWRTTHELDPYKPLRSNVTPITIQVVALDWKWLFIYPEQGIATVNFLPFPENTPITFHLTADAPMNSFWIPSLGSQVYAMPGMSTQLHLIADGIGSYTGVSANFSGAGFSGMKFTAQSISQADFDAWAQSVRQLQHPLSLDEYNILVQPTSDVPAAYYSSVENDLYNTIVKKFMAPPATASQHTMSGMDMAQ